MGHQRVVTAILGASLLAMLSAGALTGIALRYALRKRMVDVPNERSSHAGAVPRGGGIAIALTVCAALAMITFAERHADPDAALRIAPVALTACSLLAMLGWIDDHRSLSAAVRLAVQLAVAALAVVWMTGGMWPWWLMALATVLFAWFVNLYNFMDGTDGIAALQAVLAGSFMTVAFVVDGLDTAALIAGVTAGASAGFLVWNRPPARIFMGDVGSYGLGAAFAVFLVAGAAGVGTVWLAALLTGAFICDATLTLIARLLRGERFHEAHRQHAYQRMVQCGWSHGRVLGAFTLINLLWCWPLAALSLLEPELAAAGTGLCFAGLGALWFAAQRHHAARGPAP